jgi:NAD(P)H-hydrate repair Nnr-like enzyme with NAD(P)H-hydrate dehydratase domain
VAPALGAVVPEAAVLGLDEDDDGNLAPSAAPRILERAGRAGAVLVGPGFGDPAAVLALLDGVLPRVEVPVVVDAVASAYLTAHPSGLAHLDGRAVLTVNVSELAETAGLDDVPEGDAPAVAAGLADRCGVVVLCGGEVKVVAAPDGRMWRVEGGTPGLGVSGSGDVQAGVVAGLLARGAEPAQAAVWGGYLHARAGERLAGSVGAVGFLARDLPREVPAVLAELA